MSKKAKTMKPAAHREMFASFVTYKVKKTANKEVSEDMRAAADSLRSTPAHWQPEGNLMVAD